MGFFGDGMEGSREIRDGWQSLPKVFVPGVVAVIFGDALAQLAAVPQRPADDRSESKEDSELHVACSCLGAAAMQERA